MRRVIKDILKQLLSIVTIKEAVQAAGNQLHLRFAADGRRTSNKIGTVMAVFSILSEKQHDCDHQYTIALYNVNVSFPLQFISTSFKIFLFSHLCPRFTLLVLLIFSPEIEHTAVKHTTMENICSVFPNTSYDFFSRFIEMSEGVREEFKSVRVQLHDASSKACYIGVTTVVSNFHCSFHSETAM